MHELTENDLQKLGIPPFDVKDVATSRAQGMLNYAGILLAFRHEKAISVRSLVDWVHQHYLERGYYDEWITAYGLGNVDAFLGDFLMGRRLLYDGSVVRALDEGGYEVTTPLWYYDEPPEVFFYFDIDPTEFAEYARLLASSNARRLGIDLQIEHKDKRERAIIRKLSQQEAPSQTLLSQTVVSSEELQEKDVIENAPLVRQKKESDRHWIEQLLQERWGGIYMASRGKVYNALDLPALVAECEGERCGLLTYNVEDAACEIITLDAVPRLHGTGTALIEALMAQARQKGYRRLWLITSNDNLDALRFYQRRGFSLVAVHQNTLAEARKLKPSIPLYGDYAIPIRDEIELERRLYDGA